MKKIVIIILIFISFSCQQSAKMKHYNLFWSDIEIALFNKFSNWLPASYEKSIISNMSYVAGLKALNYSGINVMFILDNDDFNNYRDYVVGGSNLYELQYYQLLKDESSIGQFYFPVDKENVIHIPNTFDEFCKSDSICYKIEDFKIVILDYGKGNIFTEDVDKNDIPEKELSYSIGAFVSKIDNSIIYWFYIY
jgi:hypothetical protein